MEHVLIPLSCAKPTAQVESGTAGKMDCGVFMNITIDDRDVSFFDSDENLVEVADRAGIRVVAPCYRANRRKGCCKACVVEIEGKQMYACNTKPVDGMEVIIDRTDLDQLRRERLVAYRGNDLSTMEGCDCDCSSDTGCSTDSSRCS